MCIVVGVNEFLILLHIIHMVRHYYNEIVLLCAYMHVKRSVHIGVAARVCCYE